MQFSIIAIIISIHAVFLRIWRHLPQFLTKDSPHGPVSNSPWPLNKYYWQRICTSLASTLSYLFTNSSENMTCLQLCVLFIFQISNTFPPEFFFRSRLPLYKCFVSAFIQRSWRIRNWAIGTRKINGGRRLTEIKVQKTCALYFVRYLNLARYPGKTYCVWKRKK